MFPLGDYDTTETVNIPFNTFDSNDPSASVTITDLVAGDVRIYRDGSITQRTSANGVTVTLNFDGNTGSHMIHVDLSDNTDAGFYVAGSRYAVSVVGVTVDAATLNPWVGAFAIGVLLRPTVSGRTLDVSGAGVAGIDFGNIDGVLGNSNVSWVNTSDRVDVGLWLGTAVATPTVAGVPEVDLTHVAGATTNVSALATNADAILTDTNELQGDWVNTGRLDTILDARMAEASINTTGGAVDTVTTVTNQLTQTAIRSIVSGTADSGTATTLVDAARTEADTDYWVGDTLLITSGTVSGESRKIAGFTPASDTITVEPAFTQEISTNTYEIIPGESRSELRTATQTSIDAIESDTNELQVDWVNAGRLDTILDARASQTTADAIKAETVLIVADTGTTLDDHLTDIKGTAFVKDTHSLIQIETFVDVLDDGTSGNVKIATDVAAVLVDTAATIPGTITTLQSDTDDIQTRLPSALVDGLMSSDVTAISTSTAAADNLEAHALETLSVTFTTSGGSTTAAVLNLVDGSAASSTNDVYIGRILIFNNGTLDHQVTEITAYVGSTTTATITAVTAAPTASHTARMV